MDRDCGTSRDRSACINAKRGSGVVAIATAVLMCVAPVGVVFMSAQIIAARAFAADAGVAAPVARGEAQPGPQKAEPVTAGGQSAHEIAEKFARAAAGSDGQVDGSASRAAQVQADGVKSTAEAAKVKADADLEAVRRKAVEARRKAEAAVQKAADQRRSDEADMLARARSEAEARIVDARNIEARNIEARNAEARNAEAKNAAARVAEADRQAAEAERAALAAEAARLTAEAEHAKRTADAAKDQAQREQASREQDEADQRAENLRKVQQAEREAETLRIVEKLRAARAAKAAEAEQLDAAIKTRAQVADTAAADTAVEMPGASPAKVPSDAARPAASPTATDAPTTAGPVSPAMASAAPSVAAPIAQAAPTPSAATSPSITTTTTALPVGRATVILVLANGGRGLGRVGTTTADPVLCLGDTCYISQGSTRPASAMPRGVALGPGNTLGQRAGACARSLVCVYRNVELASGTASVQPVDLRLLRHDRRDVAVGSLDPSCGLASGQLVCGKPVKSPTWTAWIVPESIAVAAGPAILEAAAATKLDGRTAAVR